MLQGHVIADLVVVDDAELQNLGQLSNLQMVGAVLLNGRSRQGRPRNILGPTRGWHRFRRELTRTQK